jgi:hypothetical protein
MIDPVGRNVVAFQTRFSVFSYNKTLITSSQLPKVWEDLEPLGSSVYVRGSEVAQLLKGKKLSVLSWGDYQNVDQWQAKVFEAFGFPKAERR